MKIIGLGRIPLRNAFLLVFLSSNRGRIKNWTNLALYIWLHSDFFGFYLQSNSSSASLSDTILRWTHSWAQASPFQPRNLPTFLTRRLPQLQTLWCSKWWLMFVAISSDFVCEKPQVIHCFCGLCLQWINFYYWPWFCVSKAVHLKCCFILEPKLLYSLTVPKPLNIVQFPVSSVTGTILPN